MSSAELKLKYEIDRGSVVDYGGRQRRLVNQSNWSSKKEKDKMLVDYEAHILNLGDFEGSNSKRDQGTEDASNF